MPPSPPRLAQPFDAGWRGAGVEGVVARADELLERRRQVAIFGIGGEEAHAAFVQQGGAQGAVEDLDEHDRLLFARSEEHTSELQSLMRISYAVFCLQKKHLHIKTRTLSQLCLNDNTRTAKTS